MVRLYSKMMAECAPTPTAPRRARRFRRTAPPGPERPLRVWYWIDIHNMEFGRVPWAVEVLGPPLRFFFGSGDNMVRLYSKMMAECAPTLMAPPGPERQLRVWYWIGIHNMEFRRVPLVVEVLWAPLQGFSSDPGDDMVRLYSIPKRWQSVLPRSQRHQGPSGHCACGIGLTYITWNLGACRWL
jgi:hypothetical protein